MNKALRTSGAILAGLTLTAAVALATPNMMHEMHNAASKTNLNINMGALNGSRENGTASVRDVPGGAEVTVSVFNEPRGASEPAHIHQGRCPNVQAKPWRPLRNVVNGRSVTMVRGISAMQLKRGQYAINVHDQNKLSRYLACGNL